MLGQSLGDVVCRQLLTEKAQDYLPVLALGSTLREGTDGVPCGVGSLSPDLVTFRTGFGYKYGALCVILSLRLLGKAMLLLLPPCLQTDISTVFLPSVSHCGF